MDAVARGDVDQQGGFTSFDIEPFIDLVVGGGTPLTTVVAEFESFGIEVSTPEPGTAAICGFLLMGAASMRNRRRRAS